MRQKPKFRPDFHRTPGGFCKWCQKPIVIEGKIARRRSWHRDGCLDAYLIATDLAYCAKQTFERDKGVCQCCKLDVQRVLNARDSLWARARAHLPDNGELDRLRYEMIALGFSEKEFNDPHQHLWECDHIKPVWMARDGDLEFFALSNTQLLCIPCHRLKSKFDQDAARKWRGGGIEINRTFIEQMEIDRQNHMRIRRRD